MYLYRTNSVITIMNRLLLLSGILLMIVGCGMENSNPSPKPPTPECKLSDTIFKQVRLGVGPRAYYAFFNAPENKILLVNKDTLYVEYSSVFYKERLFGLKVDLLTHKRTPLEKDIRGYRKVIPDRFNNLEIFYPCNSDMYTKVLEQYIAKYGRPATNNRCELGDWKIIDNDGFVTKYKECFSHQTYQWVCEDHSLTIEFDLYAKVDEETAKKGLSAEEICDKKLFSGCSISEFNISYVDEATKKLHDKAVGADVKRQQAIQDSIRKMNDANLKKEL